MTNEEKMLKQQQEANDELAIDVDVAVWLRAMNAHPYWIEEQRKRPQAFRFMWLDFSENSADAEYYRQPPPHTDQR